MIAIFVVPLFVSTWRGASVVRFDPCSTSFLSSFNLQVACHPLTNLDPEAYCHKVAHTEESCGYSLVATMERGERSDREWRPRIESSTNFYFGVTDLSHVSAHPVHGV